MIKQILRHFCLCVQNNKACENTVSPLCSLTLSVPCLVFVRAGLLQNPKPENLGNLLCSVPRMLYKMGGMFPIINPMLNYKALTSTRRKSYGWTCSNC